jgi:hypothetical protein
MLSIYISIGISYEKSAGRGIGNVFFWINPVEKCTRSFPPCYVNREKVSSWRLLVSPLAAPSIIKQVPHCTRDNSTYVSSVSDYSCTDHCYLRTLVLFMSVDAVTDNCSVSANLVPAIAPTCCNLMSLCSAGNYRRPVRLWYTECFSTVWRRIVQVHMVQSGCTLFSFDWFYNE